MRKRISNRMKAYHAKRKAAISRLRDVTEDPVLRIPPVTNLNKLVIVSANHKTGLLVDYIDGLYSVEEIQIARFDK